MTALSRIVREDNPDATVVFEHMEAAAAKVVTGGDATGPKADLAVQGSAAARMWSDDGEYPLDAVERATCRIGAIDADVLKRRRRLGLLGRMIGVREPGRLADPALEALCHLVIDLLGAPRDGDDPVVRAVEAGVRPAVAAVLAARLPAIAETGSRGSSS